MRIAQIAPLYEAVPPKLYGGTERVVSYLTEALVEMGHDVTLFASGDSVTSARLEAAWPRALRLDPSIRDAMAPHMRLLEQVARVAHTRSACARPSPLTHCSRFSRCCARRRCSRASNVCPQSPLTGRFA